MLFVAAVDIARDLAAVDGNGIAIRHPVSRQRDAARILDQIDFVIRLEILQRAAGSHFHVALVDFRRSCIRGREKDIAALYRGGERECIRHAVNVQDEILAVLLHRASRLDDGSSCIAGVRVSVLQRRRAGAVIRERASGFLQQVDHVAFAQGKHLAIQSIPASKRHIRSGNADIRVVRGVDVGRAVHQVGREHERILHAFARSLWLDDKILGGSGSRCRMDGLHRIRRDGQARCRVFPRHLFAAVKNELIRRNRVGCDGVSRDRIPRNFIRRDVACCHIIALVPNNQRAGFRLRDVTKRPMHHCGRVAVNFNRRTQKVF